MLLAGLGLFAYQALSPNLPRERVITYRYPATTGGAFEARWMQGGELLEQTRFAVAPGQRQSSHRLLLAEGDYQLETALTSSAEGGSASVKSERAQKFHVDAETFTVVLE